MDWLTEKRKENLKALMKDDYNVEMSDAEVEIFGRDLVTTFSLLLDVDKSSSVPDGLLTLKGKEL